MQRAHWIFLKSFYAKAAKPISVDDIQLAVVEQRAADANLAAGMPAAALVDSELTSPVLKTRKNDLRGRTPRQTTYLKAILENDITFGTGPAGTGKDLSGRRLRCRCAGARCRPAHYSDSPGRLKLASASAFCQAIWRKKSTRIFVRFTMPCTTCSVSKKTQKMFEKQAIEIAPLAYMRGRTLNHAFVILDEAQKHDTPNR